MPDRSARADHPFPLATCGPKISGHMNGHSRREHASDCTMDDNAHLYEKQSNDDPPKPFDVNSYDDLLRFPKLPPTGRNVPSGNRDITIPVIDAIIVPTIRPSEQIWSAVKLASQARCALLVLYTDKLPAELPSLLVRHKRGEIIPFALRSNQSHQLLDLGTDLPQTLISSAARDISRKRNLGLLISRMCGWTRILFLDDDIRKLNIQKLSAAAALLDDYPVVGLQVKKFPDASVVGHARRLTGRKRERFISGGSLLVDPQRLNGFFPAIYHEDWLCIIDHLQLGQVAIGGTVGQLPSQTFNSPERARNEEFGDILASGLRWLVHARNKTRAVDLETHAAPENDFWRAATEPRFWEQILEQRAALLSSTVERFKMIRPDDPAAVRSLQAAQQRCDELRADEFVSVTETWLSNLTAWRDQFSRLPPADSVEGALFGLGLRARPRRANGFFYIPDILMGRIRARLFRRYTDKA